MVVPSASGMETMIFVFRGQPFVRAAVILSSSADTRSLDFAYGATPFIVPPFDPTEIGVTSATAHSPALTYKISLSSPTVVTASVFNPGIANHVPYSPDLSTTSATWLGQPFVRGVNLRKVETKDLDYVYKGAPFVITSSTVNDTFQVALATARSPALVQKVIFGSPTVVSASAKILTTKNHVPYNSGTSDMSQVWQGQPFIRSAFTSQDIEKTKSLDYALRGAPFVLTSSFVPPPQTINLPITTVVTGSAISPQVIATVIPQNSSVVSSSVGGTTLNLSLFVSAPAAMSASAIVPNLIASIIPNDITVITSSAGSVSLLPTVSLSSPNASATAFDINLLASIVPQDVTVVTASVGNASLLPNLLMPVTVTTASVGGISLSPTVELLAPATTSALAVSPTLVENVILQDTTVVTGSAFAPTLQPIASQTVIIPTCTAYASTSALDLIPTIVPAVAPSAAIAIPPRLAQIYISSPAEATAIGGAFVINPSITVGLLDLGANQYDSVDRAEPFDPYLVQGDLVNRGEPIEFLRTTRGVAIAVAIDPVVEVTDHITIFLGIASAIATAIPLELEQVALPVEEFRKKTVGQSGTKRAQREKEQEIIVAARLVKINGKPAGKRIQGFVRIVGGAQPTSSVTLTEGITTRVRKPWEDIKIKIARVA